MRKILLIPLFIYAAFLLEYLSYNLFGGWLKPDLLLILVVFFNLYSGIRFSLYTAVCAGLLRDAVGAHPLGVYVLIYILIAYLSTVMRFRFYQPGSRLSRWWVVFVSLVVGYVLRTLINNMLDLAPEVTFSKTILPEFFITLMVATYVFEKLKNMALSLRL